MPPAFLLLALVASAAEAAPLQSALEAHGDAAGRITEITWVLVIGGGLIFLGVLACIALALAGPAAARALLARNRWIVGAGVAFPVVVLSALLVYTFSAAAGMGREQRVPAAARIQVDGELWWWRVRYLDEAGRTLFETANEIHVPTGQPVDLELVSHDVIHSFWVPSLAGKVDLIPGRVNRLRLRAHGSGVFRGQCAEYCGAQHAKMALHVVAQPPQDYAGWLQAQRAAAAAPDAPLLQRGQALFAEKRCGACHTVRGTDFAGALGPDLTHVGSRLALAAGTLPNGQEALAGWITGNQHIKPGSRMPAYVHLPAEDLRALSAYLAQLR